MPETQEISGLEKCIKKDEKLNEEIWVNKASKKQMRNRLRKRQKMKI